MTALRGTGLVGDACVSRPAFFNNLLGGHTILGWLVAISTVLVVRKALLLVFRAGVPQRAGKPMIIAPGRLPGRRSGLLRAAQRRHQPDRHQDDRCGFRDTTKVRVSA